RGTEVTTRELAAAAGVAEGTLFRVFPDKRSIVEAAVARALDAEPLLVRLGSVDTGADLRTALTDVVALLQDSAREVVSLMVLVHRLDAAGPDVPHRRHSPDRHMD